MPTDGNAPTLGAGIGLQGARIGGGLFWRGVKGLRGLLDLTETRAASLRDDWASWDGVQTLKLDGFTYERVEGSMSVADRLKWLAKSTAAYAEDHKDSPDPAFDPQPYVQLAKVLRAQGARRGAAEVLVARERRQRKAERVLLAARRKTSGKAHRRWLGHKLLSPSDWLFGAVFGFGHKPARAVWWTLGLILVAGLLNLVAFSAGQFAPNSPVIMTSQAWLDAVAASKAEGAQESALALWLAGDAARDYETFTWWLYGIDLVLPFDTLGQEEAWRATTGKLAEGHLIGNLAFYSRWFFQIAGILLAAVGAAVLTGLVGRRD